MWSFDYIYIKKSYFFIFVNMGYFFGVSSFQCLGALKTVFQQLISYFDIAIACHL
jgi:hypothetical protein